MIDIRSDRDTIITVVFMREGIHEYNNNNGSIVVAAIHHTWPT